MNERQAKVYLSILQNNDSSASELHRISGLPLNKTYETLVYLTNNGFCIKRNNSKSKTTYTPTDPRLIFQKIIEDKKSHLENTLKLINGLVENLSEIYLSIPKHNEFSEYIDVIHGNLSIHKKFVELVRNSNKTIMAISCPPYAVNSKKQNDEQTKVVDDFFERGGSAKSINEINEDSPHFVFNSIADIHMIYDNDETRISPKNPMKLYIFDNNILMTFSKPNLLDGNELCASIIKQPNAVETFTHMFEFLWNQAQPVEKWKKQNKKILEKKIIEYYKSK